jgi:hypothetical protein
VEQPKNYLAKRARQLNLGREDELRRIQALLEALWPAQTRAVSLNAGVLKVLTPNASVASELRLRQVEILPKLRAAAHSPIERLRIQISAI